jgi:hypothetical protein
LISAAATIAAASHGGAHMPAGPRREWSIPTFMSASHVRAVGRRQAPIVHFSTMASKSVWGRPDDGSACIQNPALSNIVHLAELLNFWAEVSALVP